jgi:serine/threonine protein kinase
MKFDHHRRTRPDSALPQPVAGAPTGAAPVPQRAGGLALFDSLPGRTLGDYQVLETISSGTSGTVYRARDLRVGRLVALKVLPAALAADPDSLRRFHREASCLSALSHPNVITLFEIEQVEGTLFLVMEHIDGPTLASLLPPGGFPMKQALNYARQIAAGLAAAHEKGIVHRDLKLSNLLVTEDGTIKIADFGLAKLMHPPGDVTDCTRHGMILGTVDYMSPEQVRGEQADTRSDVFSFGVVLCELLTSVRPFQRSNSPETWAAILKEDPLAEISIAQPVRRILARCLSKQRAERFQNARELLVALSDIKASSESPRLERSFGRHRLVRLALAIALGLSGWGGYRLLSQSRPEEPVTPALQFDRGIAAEEQAEATKCFNGSAARCDVKTASSTLHAAVKAFDGILQTHPRHLATLWHSALAWSNLCELASRLGDSLEARNSCDRAIANFDQALEPGKTYAGLPNSVPDSARIRFNLGLTLNLRAQLPGTSAVQRNADFSAAMAQFDRLLSGGAPMSDFVRKRRADIEENRRIASDGRTRLSGR